MDNNSYECRIDHDAQGVFLEVYELDGQGKRGEMHLSIFVNADEGETVDEAIQATEIELYDPIEVKFAGEPPHIVERQRAAFQWLKKCQQTNPL